MYTCFLLSLCCLVIVLLPVVVPILNEGTGWSRVLKFFMLSCSICIKKKNQQLYSLIQVPTSEMYSTDSVPSSSLTEYASQSTVNHLNSKRYNVLDKRKQKRTVAY